MSGKAVKINYRAALSLYGEGEEESMKVRRNGVRSFLCSRSREWDGVC